MQSAGARQFWAPGDHSGGFSPARLANLTLWYDAQDPSKIPANPVSTWLDSGPNGKTLSQFTSINRPDYLTNQAAFANRACVEISEGDTVQNWLPRSSDTVTTQTAGTISAAVAWTFFEDRVLLSVSQNTDTDRWWQIYARDEGSLIRPAVMFRNGAAGTEGGAYANDAQSSLTLNQAYIVTVSGDGTALRMWINGRQYGGGGPGTLTGLGAAGNDGTWIGDITGRDRLALGVRLLNGNPVTTPNGRVRIAELVMTAPEASTTEIAAMHSYLSARYGIALSP